MYQKGMPAFRACLGLNEMKERRARQTYTNRGFPMRKLEELNGSDLALYHFLVAYGKPEKERLELVSDLMQERFIRNRIETPQTAISA